MNRYEITLYSTLSVRAKSEVEARAAFERAETLASSRQLAGVTVCYSELGDEIDCMEVSP